MENGLGDIVNKVDDLIDEDGLNTSNEITFGRSAYEFIFFIFILVMLGSYVGPKLKKMAT